MNTELLQGFYLGDFYIEPLKGQVVGNGATAHLPPKAAEVLLCLASHPGELVSREDLIECVWGDGRGSGELLSHAVSEIRHALGDHADDPRFVQTLPRRGYRLVVDAIPATNGSDSIVLGAPGATQDIGLFESLQRRGVLETAFAYLVVGWLAIQVADIVFDQLRLPTWTGTFVTALVIAGFPIALVLSWFLEFRDGKAVFDTRTPKDQRRRRFSRTYLSIVCSLVAAGILVALFDFYFGLPEEKVQPPAADLVLPSKLPPILENSIAVLPFLNVDGGQETQVFANGLVDDVTNRLARVPGLSVSARGDAFTLDPNSPSKLVRDRLRVAMYIEGSVEMAADSIRVIVQIIDSATGRHIQSRTFDHPRENYFRVRDEVTNLTVSSLRVALPDDVQAKSQATARAPEYDAYLRYRRGIDELDKPGNLTTLNAALAWMDAALDVDSEYAAAYAGKCRAYVVLFRETSDAEMITNAEEACASALSRNPNLDVVHQALGDLLLRTGMHADAESAYVESLRINPKNVDAMLDLAEVYRLQQRFDQAEGLLMNALGLQPGNWRAYAALGNFYYRRGDFAEAAEQFGTILTFDDDNEDALLGLASSLVLEGDFEQATPVFARAIDMRPDPKTYSNLGLMYYYLGHYDAAMDAVRAGLELAPNDHLMWANLGDILTVAGRHGDARNAYERAKELVDVELGVNPNDPGILMDVAWIQAMLGEESEARRDIAKAMALAPSDPYASYYEGLINASFGDAGAAMDALERAVENGYPIELLAAEPLLESLRENPIFKALTNTN